MTLVRLETLAGEVAGNAIPIPDAFKRKGSCIRMTPGHVRV